MTKATPIACPKCGQEIELNEAISHNLREQMTGEFEEQRKKQSAALAEREAQLEKQKNALAAQQASLHTLVQQKLAEEKKTLLGEAQKRAEEKLTLEFKDLQEQLREKQSRLSAAQEEELKWRREKRELQEARERMELDLARRLDAERTSIGEAARQQVLETEKLRLADRDNKIRELSEQIKLLQQRAEQGSMQAQGETLEISLEQDLRAAFRDQIEEIRKGERGADIRQTVLTQNGTACGTILWEAKRARNWSPQWPEKLKANQRDAKAELSVLVTTTPPPGLRGIGLFEGVWVCEPPFACALAAALRQGLISTEVQRTQESGRHDKMNQIYDYLCSVSFRQHIEGLVESFTGLREQLDAEQRAFERQWKEREKQLQRILQHTAGLYGEIQGIAGRGCIPEIPLLRLPGAGPEKANDQRPLLSLEVETDK
jgi:hypothetical protein